MKKGDLLNVIVEGIVVAKAEIVAVRNDEVEFVIPATHVTAAAKTTITPEPVQSQIDAANEKQTIVTGTIAGDTSTSADGAAAPAAEETTNASSEPSTGASSADNNTTGVQGDGIKLTPTEAATGSE